MLFLRQNCFKFRLCKLFNYRFTSVCACPPPPVKPVVTILDVSSDVGSNLALLLKQNPLITELRIYDEHHDTACIAEDLNHIDTKVGVIPFQPSALKEAIKGAYIVISTGGCRQKILQTPVQLLDSNLDNVRTVALFLSEFNPSAIYYITRPPIDVMVPLVSEEYKKNEVYDPRKIVGLTTFCAMAANRLLANHLKVDPATILCPLIGGASLNTIVPVISQIRPNVEYNPKVYTTLHSEIASVEDKVLFKGCSWCYSKAAGIARFVNLQLKALKGNQKCVECAFVAQTGHIRDFLPYMTSVVKLGPEGVVSTHMPKINEFEITRLKSVLPDILKNITLGQTYLGGDFSSEIPLKPKRKADQLLRLKVKELTASTECGEMNLCY